MNAKLILIFHNLSLGICVSLLPCIQFIIRLNLPFFDSYISFSAFCAFSLLCTLLSFEDTLCCVHRLFLYHLFTSEKMTTSTLHLFIRYKQSLLLLLSVILAIAFFSTMVSAMPKQTLYLAMSLNVFLPALCQSQKCYSYE